MVEVREVEVREWWKRYGSGGTGTGAVVEVRERW